MLMSHQQSLFDTEPAPWELDDAAEQLVATVVIAGRAGGRVRLSGAGRLVAERSAGAAVEPGRRVRVPLGRGNRSVVGYCVALATKPTGGRKLKSVARRARSPAAVVAAPCCG